LRRRFGATRSSFILRQQDFGGWRLASPSGLRAAIYNNIMTSVEFGWERVELRSRKSGRTAFEIERVAAAAHYVIFRTEPGKLGHIKLNRILWYADLEHYRRNGTSITGLQHYLRAPQGPLSSDIPRAVGLLVKRKWVTERSVAVADYTRREMVSLQEPDFTRLGDDVIAILDRMISVVAPLTASELVKMTSADPLCQEIKPGGAMVVSTGSIITQAPSASPQDRQAVRSFPQPHRQSHTAASNQQGVARFKKARNAGSGAIKLSATPDHGRPQHAVISLAEFRSAYRLR
jgi:hypothetical protein